MSNSESKRVQAEQVRAAVRQARSLTSESLALLAPTIDPALIADTVDMTVHSKFLLDDDKDLTISVPLWAVVAPPGRTDKLTVYRAGAGGTKEAFFSDDYNRDDAGNFPLPIIVPKDTLKSWGDGEQSLSYRVESFGGSDESSDELTLRFDRVAPYTNKFPAQFPAISNVTDANIDSVVLMLPEYSDFAAGDNVTVYWGKTVDYLTPIFAGPVGTLPQSIPVPKDAITEVGDGGVLAFYILTDKAGNISQFSVPTAVGVAIGPLPSGLLDPEVPLAADDLIDQEDAWTGVIVEVPQFQNWKPTDRVQVTWGTLALGWREIGSAPTFPLQFNLLPKQLWEQYGAAATGEVVTAVSYEVQRGTVPQGSRSINVNVNLERIGPVDPGTGPDPEWPNPVNPKLALAAVYGAVSKTKDHLKEEDETQDAILKFTLDAAFKVADTVSFYWSGKHVVEADHTVATDEPGTEIEVSIPWAYIEERNNGDVPVHYEISRQDFPNRSVSKSTSVLSRPLSCALWRRSSLVAELSGLWGNWTVLRCTMIKTLTRSTRLFVSKYQTWKPTV